MSYNPFGTLLDKPANENFPHNWKTIFHRSTLKKNRQDAYRIVGITERSTSKAINESDALGANHLGNDSDKLGIPIKGFWEIWDN